MKLSQHFERCKELSNKKILEAPTPEESAYYLGVLETLKGVENFFDGANIRIRSFESALNLAKKAYKQAETSKPGEVPGQISFEELFPDLFKLLKKLDETAKE